jgi:hypothetical protein
MTGGTKSLGAVKNNPYLRRVDRLSVGVWLELRSKDHDPLRCKLTSKIDSIDKLLFVNDEGAKIAELTRMQLAKKLKTGAAKILGSGSLVDRAMRSVIHDLQQTNPDRQPKSTRNAASA